MMKRSDSQPTGGEHRRMRSLVQSTLLRICIAIPMMPRLKVASVISSIILESDFTSSVRCRLNRGEITPG